MVSHILLLNVKRQILIRKRMSFVNIGQGLCVMATNCFVISILIVKPNIFVCMQRIVQNTGRMGKKYIVLRSTIMLFLWLIMRNICRRIINSIVSRKCESSKAEVKTFSMFGNRLISRILQLVVCLKKVLMLST